MKPLEREKEIGLRVATCAGGGVACLLKAA